MKRNNFFTRKEYGFISGRSTALQLLEVLDKWTEALDLGYSIDCVYMDYQKAYDAVPHKRLHNKLTSYGIHEQLIAWIDNFLSNRVQQVGVNGERSAWHNVTSGIPQGSVFVPLLFVIFINDIPETVNSDAYLFADDTKIFKMIKSSDDSTILQEDLTKLEEWSDTWLLRFHPDNCKNMHIGKKNDDNSYSLHRKLLEKVIEEKDIGVVIDSDLTFEKHINGKVNKANQMFTTLRRTFQFMDKSTFVQLCNAFARTHLDYASSVWAPFKAKHIEQIEGVQRRATKQIPGFRDMTYSERLRALKLPSLSYRKLRGDMIEVYKILSGKYDQDAWTILKLWKDMAPRSSIRGNSLKLYPQRA